MNDTLLLLAETIVAGLGFEVAVVNLVEADGSLRAAAVAGPEAVRELLLGASQRAASWDVLLGASESWGSLRFLDHRTAPEDPEDLLMWVPDLEASEDPERWHPYDALFAPLFDRGGALLGVLSVDVPRDGRRPDATARAMLEAFGVAAALAIEQSALYERVNVSEQLFRAVFEASPVAIAITGSDQRLHSVNPAYCRLLGRGPDELLGRSPLEFTSPEDRDANGALHRHVLEAGEQGRLEQHYVHKDGRLVIARLQLARLGEGSHARVLAQVEDITEAKRHESELRFHATHDALTGLPNRASLMDGLAAALRRSATTHDLVAVLFCDLDRVKLINDRHGHATGDEYIRALGRRMRSVLRGNDVVGRLGGDEFIVVAEHLTSPTEVLGLAGRLMDAVRAPLQLGRLELAPSMSMGVAYEIGGGTNADQLLADADAAMYEAKTHGRGAWRVFTPTPREPPLLQLELRHQIGPAIEQHQFALHYQPVVRLSDRQLVGYEALLRWQHPTQGLLAPGAFLDMIVDSEYETPVTDWVIGQAARDAANWPGGSRPFMSFNVSAFQLAREDLPGVVAAALVEHDIDPHRMAIELTEDRFLEESLGASRLQALRDTGIRLSIDDFGTGFASLSYVQRRPVTTLKIDRSFIAPLPGDAASRDIIGAICHLARSRGLYVVAEGIETPGQLDALRALGVGYGQGYYLGRPAPVQAYAEAAVRTAE